MPKLIAGLAGLAGLAGCLHARTCREDAGKAAEITKRLPNDRASARDAALLTPANQDTNRKTAHVDGQWKLGSDEWTISQAVVEISAGDGEIRGAAFLAVYGWQALRRARHVHRLDASVAGSSLSLAAAVAQAAAFTLLNPHVYLDTVLLVGSNGAQQPAALRG